jgi:hypothetical protein
MIEPTSRQERGLRPGHKLTVVAVGVIAVIVAFFVVHTVFSLVAILFKTIVVIAIIGGVLYLVFRHAGRRRL